MEEGLLERPMIDEKNLKEDETQEPLTPVVVLSTLVALCGSLCLGCIVSIFSFSVSGPFSLFILSISLLLSNFSNFSIIWIVEFNFRDQWSNTFLQTRVNKQFALQIGYSSPAEAGIMKDLDLSVADVCISFESFFHLSQTFSSPLLWLTLFSWWAVLGFRFNSDSWRNDRCASKWETSRSLRSQSGKCCCLYQSLGFNSKRFATCWFFCCLWLLMQTMWLSEVLSTAGWTAIALGKVSLPYPVTDKLWHKSRVVLIFCRGLLKIKIDLSIFLVCLPLVVVDCLVARRWKALAWTWIRAYLLCGNFHEIFFNILDFLNKHLL